MKTCEARCFFDGRDEFEFDYFDAECPLGPARVAAPRARHRGDCGCGLLSNRTPHPVPNQHRARCYMKILPVKSCSSISTASQKKRLSRRARFLCACCLRQELVRSPPDATMARTTIGKWLDGELEIGWLDKLCDLWGSLMIGALYAILVVQFLFMLHSLRFKLWADACGNGSHLVPWFCGSGEMDKTRPKILFAG